jgi:hypothetical protein
MHPSRPRRQRDIDARIHQNRRNPLHRKPDNRDQFPRRQFFIPNLHPIHLPREIKRPIRNATPNHSGYRLLAAGYFFVI